VSVIDGDAGKSLASQYDVKGSSIGVAELRDQDGVSLIHDMAAVISAERGTSGIRRILLNQGQSTTGLATITDLALNMSFLRNLFLGADVSTDWSRVTILAADEGGREIPIFNWSTGEPTTTGRIVDPTLGTAPEFFINQLPFNPLLLCGTSQPVNGIFRTINLRGQTTAFGAGTVDLVALLQIEGTAIGGISSYGVPLPAS